jgi:hypothetical protein
MRRSGKDSYQPRLLLPGGKNRPLAQVKASDKKVIDVNSAVNPIEPGSRYLFIAINHELFCHLDRKEEDDTNIVLPEIREPSQRCWHQPGRAQIVQGRARSWLLHGKS